MDLDIERLQFLFASAGLDPSRKQLEAFWVYHQELLAGNRRASLISAQDENRIVERHFIESALLSLFDEFRGDREVLDLGSGAGFPGLPLKILRPSIYMTLLDSKRKKALFLSELLPRLNVDGVEVVESRAEDLAKIQAYRERFEIVVTRAVARLNRLFAYAQPLLKEAGLLVSIKGSGLQEEIAQLQAGFGAKDIEIRELPGKPFPVSQNLKVVFIRNVRL